MPGVADCENCPHPNTSPLPGPADACHHPCVFRVQFLGTGRLPFAAEEFSPFRGLPSAGNAAYRQQKLKVYRDVSAVRARNDVCLDVSRIKHPPRDGCWHVHPGTPIQNRAPVPRE